jgi:heavy metal efflux system protein
MENILKSGFPEVEQVVSRIGAAEVPTDPMSMEEIDMIIKLKPMKSWVTATNKEELAGKFKEALSVIPGVEYEFTQPIEMRFNELITGVRSDIAIKIFGDDLDYINNKAIEVKNLVEGIPGAGDVILEKTSGLPQVRVAYNRSRIAYYGLNIGTLNKYLSAAFGGEAAGVVFEGEKSFDMVVRFDKQNRTDIKDIRQLYVPLNNGQQVPLAELASIDYAEGPAKISRENTHRRVVVSVNVRNRDLQSVIKDIQSTIEKKVTFQPGTYVAYGGQFENLQNAKKRLMIAVPIALLLIFIFLHFAFGSFRDALMIYTAIPLSIVGGVVLLWLRGMPFSVSAGVGFIALFGIAVLNGIVLIEHLKELQHAGVSSMRELIIKGTNDRLRPVLLTAGAAAMGFLPMAVSTGAGAEVQRPLATVVIGGLFTSTLLTMIALPLLFEIFNNVKGFRFFPFRVIRDKPVIMILLLILWPAISSAQSHEMGLPEILDKAVAGNKEIKVSNLRISEAKALKGSAWSIDKTVISYGTDQNNIAENGYPINVWGVQQSISFPTLYSAEARAKTIEISKAEEDLAIVTGNLKRELSVQYYQLQNLLRKQIIFSNIDSLYGSLLRSAELKYGRGDISRLDLLNIRARQQQAQLNLKNTVTEIRTTMEKMKVLMNTTDDFSIHPITETESPAESEIENIPLVRLMKLGNTYSEALLKIERNKMLPDLNINYFTGTNHYPESKYYQGFQVGVAVPLFFGSFHSKISSAKISLNARQIMTEYQTDIIRNKISGLKAGELKYREAIELYKSTGKVLHDEILNTALKSYTSGEIDLFKFTTSFENAVLIEIEYLDNVLRCNIAVAEQKYPSN